MRLLLRILGILLCTLPPTLSILAFFPFWLAYRETAVSAVALLFLALSCVPLFLIFKSYLRTPAPWMIWLGIWGILFAFRPILPAMQTVALISFPTALLGALCFRIAKHLTPDTEGE